VTQTDVERPSDAAADGVELERRRRLWQSGRGLVPKLWGMLRTLGMYDADNETPHRALAILYAALQEILSYEEATALIVTGDAAFLNGCRLRLDHASYRLVSRLSEYMSKRDLGGICFQHGVQPEQIMRFLKQMQDAAMQDDPRTFLFDYLASQDISEITLINPHRHQEGLDTRNKGLEAKRTALEIFARAMLAFNEQDLLGEGALERRRQTVAVRRLVVLAEHDPETFLQLASVRALGSPWTSHSLNITVLALALGRKIGLSRKHLVRLGIAAMNHNIGEIRAQQNTSLAEGESEQAHPLLGLGYLLGGQELTQRLLQRAIVAAEHHRHFDGFNGFPELPPAKPHLFSRIISICDAYDTLVWSQQDNTRLPPDQAFRRITRGAGSLYDPTLVQVFSAMIGRYPPGSLVELDNGDLAVVIAHGEGEEGQSRPIVLRIRDALGRETDPLPMDLSVMVPGKRRYRASIARTRDPVRLDINTASYLFSAEAVAAVESLLGIDPEPSLNSHQG